MGAAMATLCALDLRFRLQPVPDVSAVVAIFGGLPQRAFEPSVRLTAHAESIDLSDMACVIAGARVYFWVAAGGQRCVCNFFRQRLPGARPSSSICQRCTCILQPMLCRCPVSWVLSAVHVRRPT